MNEPSLTQAQLCMESLTALNHQEETISGLHQEENTQLQSPCLSSLSLSVSILIRDAPLTRRCCLGGYTPTDNFLVRATSDQQTQDSGWCFSWTWLSLEPSPRSTLKQRGSESGLRSQRYTSSSTTQHKILQSVTEDRLTLPQHHSCW